MEAVSEKKRVVNFFLNNNLLISADFINNLGSDFNEVELNNRISEKIDSEHFLIIFKDLNMLLDKPDKLNLNWVELEKSLALLEKGKDTKTYEKFLEYASSPKTSHRVKVVLSYKEDSKKRGVQDFVSYFNIRYKSLEGILRHRSEMVNLSSINRVINKKDKDTVSLIGIVKEKQITKNNNLVLTIEDNTGQIKILVNKNKSELFNPAKDIVLDEVIGVNGVNSNGIIFANNILWPDVPSDKKIKKSTDEVFALFLSDLHVGSNNFLPEQFQRFLNWLNLKVGNEKQNEMAKKVKYLFIVGDLVDGVGIYPAQDTELFIKDIYEQYKACAELLRQIPNHINVIICPGNHDAVRMAEPQPELYRDIAEPIFSLPNVILVSNPSLVNIHSSKDFEGFDVLLYHGYSFDYYVANVDSIRNNGGYDRPDLIMKFLLKRRHLAPSHTSTLYIPDAKKDPLVITKIPDFFVTGHIHKSSIASYKNITMICGSCWQSKTTFQQKVGHHPEPCRVPIVNLKTRESKILRFN